MHTTLNHLLSTPLDIGWKLLTVLTAISTLEMTRGLLRRTRHLTP
jgi:hypothetical protein